MKKILITVTGLVLVAAIAGDAWFMKGVHDDYVRLLADSPEPLAVAIESERLHSLREEMAAGKWRLIGQDTRAYDDMFGSVGMKPQVAGLAELVGHPRQPFDWADMDKNKRNVVIAMLRSIYHGKPDDGTLHLNKTKTAGVIFLKENVVEFHKDTDAGILSGSLIRVTPEIERHSSLSDEMPEL